MICTIDGCDAPAITRGWCKTHYTRWIENGSTERLWACQTCGTALDHSSKRYCKPSCKPKWIHPKVCSVDECTSPVNARGWCSTHYGRWLKHGDPEQACLGCGTVITRRHPGRHAYCGPQCKPKCAVAECGQPIRGRTENYCVTHSGQTRKTGEQPRIIGTPWASEYKCVVCAAVVERGTRRRRYCSAACSQMASSLRRGRCTSFECGRCGDVVSLMDRVEGKRKRADSRLCEPCRRSRCTPHKMSVSVLAKRDGTECGICGQFVNMAAAKDDWFKPSVDHVVPRAHGGSDDPINLQLAHLWCNQKKSARLDYRPEMASA